MRVSDWSSDVCSSDLYVAAVYREKASGARADRPELLRMIADLQPGEVVIAEKIDRISRLPLTEAEQLVETIRARGARLAIPGVLDLSDLAADADGIRSEEHTSELQSLMRTSYAVLMFTTTHTYKLPL